MKVLLFTLSVIGCAIAEAPYPASGTKPEGALLLLPPEYRTTTNQGRSSQLRTETEDLSTVSDRVMERLRQEQGSGSGTYHVYLADGSLQKVQFTTAPLKTGQQNSASQQSSGYQDLSGSQQVELFSAQLNRQQSGQRSEQQQNSYNQQFSQQEYSQKQQLYPVYRPQQTEQQSADSYSQQYNQQQTAEASSKQYSQYKQTKDQESELNPIIAQFGKLQQEFQQKQIEHLQQKQQELELQQQELKQQQEELRSASYVASLRYTNVEPITSPIYSYKSSPVTRILRYAPQYF